MVTCAPKKKLKCNVHVAMHKFSLHVSCTYLSIDILSRVHTMFVRSDDKFAPLPPPPPKKEHNLWEILESNAIFTFPSLSSNLCAI